MTGCTVTVAPPGTRHVWLLKHHPTMEPMGEMVRAVDINDRTLLIERRLASRLAACGEPPTMRPTEAQVWRWVGLAFMLGCVIGAATVALAWHP